MIQTTVTNVICPAVATHDPNALLDQVICNSIQLHKSVFSCSNEHTLQLIDALALFVDTSFVALISIEERFSKFFSNEFSIFRDQFTGDLGRFVDRQAHTQTKLSVVFKQRVGPGRSLTLLVDSPWSGGLVAAINGGTTGCVGDDHAITKKLSSQLDIGSLATTTTSTRELKQGFELLRILDIGCLDVLTREQR